MTTAGATIARGETVIAMLGSANRDKRQFEQPDLLDITRQPNRQLSFGQGVHYCVDATGTSGGANRNQHALAALP